ncbi:PREDICTED: USP6 N-terminal-like protein [Galeopterus variegatus]|uniref:USP6 N-terminal-like protein n=1 Tax=Galeopterus variegatus TaxID=482537 RepID=A0ABM0SDW2_GALVR|nr:PREDICTED: USP6 N-terminal-like protein [Galeopterus variegatus]
MSCVHQQTKKEMARCHKWLKMFQHWDKYKGSQKMSRRVYKGIPPQVRGRAWSLLLGVDKVNMQNPGKYQAACGPSLDSVRGALSDSHPSWRIQTEVGYCEGMSHIAAILLMHLNEEDAFWALVQLMTNRRHNMHGFYIPGSPKLRILQFFHELLLRTILPQLQKHLKSAQFYWGLIPGHSWAASLPMLERTSPPIVLKAEDT